MVSIVALGMRARFVEVALSLFLGALESLGALELLPGAVLSGAVLPVAVLFGGGVPATALTQLLPAPVLAAPQENAIPARHAPAARAPAARTSTARGSSARRPAAGAVHAESATPEYGAAQERAPASSPGAAPPARSPSAAGPPARVLLRGCEGMQESEVERVLSAELGTQSNGHPTSGSGSSEPTWIVVRCADGQITVEVNDPLSRKTLLRTFDEGSLPPRARARLVAIAAAELVLASWAELTYQPSLRVQPLGPVASEKDVHAVLARLEAGTGVRVAEAAAEPALPNGPIARPWYAPLPREERMFHLSGLGSMRTFLQHPGALWGAGVRVSEEALSATSWSVDALYEGGTLTGKQDLRYRIQTWSFAASLLFYHRVGVITARAGAGLRVGAVKAESLDRDLGGAKNVLVPWGWPLLVVSLSARSGPIVLNVSGEGSYAAVPVAGGTITPISGFWLGTQWGIGFVP